MASRGTILTVAASMAMAASACTERSDPTSLPAPTPSIPATPTAPVPPVSPVPPATPSRVAANAGPDVLIPFRGGAATLSVSAYAYGRQVVSYMWKKMSGPGSVAILNPDSKQTEVANLELGVHEFQVTVTDDIGGTGADTVRVIVYDARFPAANEAVFTDREWQCPFGCVLTIANFQGAPPNLDAMNVLLKVGGQWAKISNSGSALLWYFDKWGFVNIYSDADMFGREEVKIVF